MTTTTNPSDLYYDPFDIEIDKDPHPLWRRMREEAPLYRNEKYGFYALSRYDEVERGLVDWDTFRSGKGSTLEVILAGFRRRYRHSAAADRLLERVADVLDFERDVLHAVAVPDEPAALGVLPGKRRDQHKGDVPLP